MSLPQQPTNHTSGIIPARSLGAEDNDSQNPSYILLFGCAGTGKTSFVNVAGGSKAEIGMGVRSTTQGVLTSEPFYVDNNLVVLIDFPGFNDANLAGTDVLRLLAKSLIALSSGRCKIAGFFYIHKITDTRVGGASLRSMNAFKAICGTDSLKSIVYVTNMWSDPPTKSEIKREEELRESGEFFGWPLSQGAQMARHTNTKESAHDVIRSLLSKEPTVPKLLKQLVEEHLALEETDVGRLFGQDFRRDELYRQHRQELAHLRHRETGSSAEGRLQWYEEGQLTHPSIPAVDALTDLRAAMKNRENESEQKFNRNLDRMDKSWSNHQERSKQQDEQIERHIANIASLSPTDMPNPPTSWTTRISKMPKMPKLPKWLNSMAPIETLIDRRWGSLSSDSPEHDSISDRETPRPQVRPTENVTAAFQPSGRGYRGGGIIQSNMGAETRWVPGGYWLT